MNRYGPILLRLLLHGLLAGGLIWRAYLMLGHLSGGLGAIGGAMVGLGLIVLAAIVLAIPVASLVAEPSGSIFYPTMRRRRPPPMYGIPESQVKRGDYSAAMETYAKITRSHPEEVRPYAAMMEIAILHQHDLALGSEIYRSALKAFSDEESRMWIMSRYRETSARERVQTERGSDTESVHYHGRPQDGHGSDDALREGTGR